MNKKEKLAFFTVSYSGSIGSLVLFGTAQNPNVTNYIYPLQLAFFFAFTLAYFLVSAGLYSRKITEISVKEKGLVLICASASLLTAMFLRYEILNLEGLHATQAADHLFLASILLILLSTYYFFYFAFRQTK